MKSSSSANPRTRSPLVAARPWLVIGLIALAYCYPRHAWTYYSNVNETARLYLVQAIADHGVLHIDHGIAAYGDVIDKAVAGGHSYCDKPIGLSLLAVPFYAVLKNVAAWFVPDVSLETWRYLLTLICVSLPSVLAVVWLRGFWRDWTGDALLADFAALVYGLGTIAYTYSTQFMGHQIGAALAVAHFALSRHLRTQYSWRALVAAGALTGFGAITEYYSVFVHLLIAMTYLRPRRAPALTVCWTMSAAIAGSPLLIYNALCFGGPFKMAYGFEAAQVFQTQHGTGFFGVTYPRLESLWGLLFSGRKGLFFLSPALALATLALAGLRKKDARRGDIALWSAACAVIFLLAMSVHNWLAGLTVGPRHMVTALPFVMCLYVEGLRRWPRLRPWAVGLSLIGMVFVGVATLTLPAFAWDLANPVAEQAFFLAGHGLFSPNLGHAIGLSGAWSLVPLLAFAALVTVAFIVSLRAERRRVLSPASLLSPAIAVAWAVAVAHYEPDPPVLRTLFQGRALVFVGQLQEAAPRLEKAIEMMPTPEVLQETAPHLMLIYRETQNAAAAERLRRRVEAIDTGRAPPSP